MKNNPYPYIANANLYVQPSRYENYSVVILEAMVLKKTILATKPAGDQQIIDGVNGRLCDDNPQSIANVIEELMNDSRERKKYIDFFSTFSFNDENNKIVKQLDCIINS